MARKPKQLRYVEISHRNPRTRLFVGMGNQCFRTNTCDSFCIEIIRAGGQDCRAPVEYSACCQPQPKPMCDPHVATVCALEVDDDGYAVFEWPKALMELTEGWYIGIVKSDCHVCGEFPVRIGPRCNVIEVETTVMGPDNACWVGCEDDCNDDICKPRTPQAKTVYRPDYLN